MNDCKTRKRLERKIADYAEDLTQRRAFTLYELDKLHTMRKELEQIKGVRCECQ